MFLVDPGFTLQTQLGFFRNQSIKGQLTGQLFNQEPGKKSHPPQTYYIKRKVGKFSPMSGGLLSSSPDSQRCDVDSDSLLCSLPRCCYCVRPDLVAADNPGGGASHATPIAPSSWLSTATLTDAATAGAAIAATGASLYPAAGTPQGSLTPHLSSVHRVCARERSAQ